MSCGNPHELDCSDALDKIYEYLDGEVDPHDHDVIAQHLDECAPCLAEFDLEALVKVVVARSCCDHAPSQLRAKVVGALVARRIRLDPPAQPERPTS